MDSTVDTLRRATVGSPSLRRAVRSLGSERAGQVTQELSGIDPKRFRSLYKQRLRDVVSNERAAFAAAQDPSSIGIAARNDPYRYGSVASSNYRTLYR